MIEFHVLTPNRIEEVLQLQQRNLRSNLSADQQNEQGFLTITHSAELLKKMTEKSPSVIAVQDNTIAGFCLSMEQEFRYEVPVLVPMFELFDHLVIEGEPLRTRKYITIGQVCVAEDFRGKKVFDGLYQTFRSFHKDYDLAVTEISARNKRSMAAHARVGFRFFYQYTAPDGEVWNVVYWKW